jgi:hypothetical protein
VQRNPVGSGESAPEQPLAFTLVFLLAMHGAVPSSRRELAALFWPDAGNAEQNHHFFPLHRLPPQDSSDCDGAASVEAASIFGFGAPPRSSTRCAANHLAGAALRAGTLARGARRSHEVDIGVVSSDMVEWRARVGQWCLRLATRRAARAHRM